MNAFQSVHNTDPLSDRPRENKSEWCLISQAGILAINNALIKEFIFNCQKYKS